MPYQILTLQPIHGHIMDLFMAPTVTALFNFENRRFAGKSGKQFPEVFHWHSELAGIHP